MLLIDRVRKTYRSATKPALEEVSLRLERGDFLALLGPNGAGKSTLVHILSGRADADGGAVSLDGEPLDRRHAHLRSRIGVVPQEIRFDFVFTVRELLRLERGLFGLRPDEHHIDELLERLSLADKRDVRVRELSGGMQRRLMVARALVHRPRLLLLDEPTAGVDVGLRRQMHGFLRDLNSAGMTILLTTHYLEEAEELCPRIALLDGGRVVADESREAFLRLAGDFVTVQIDTYAPVEVLRLFRRRGLLPVSEEPGRLRFEIGAASRQDLLASLSEASSHIHAFGVQRPRLEDVFVRLTAREELPHARTA